MCHYRRHYLHGPARLPRLLFHRPRCCCLQSSQSFTSARLKTRGTLGDRDEAEIVAIEGLGRWKSSRAPLRRGFRFFPSAGILRLGPKLGLRNRIIAEAREELRCFAGEPALVREHVRSVRCRGMELAHRGFDPSG